MKENLERAGSEFNIEIERAITQNSQETHETDLDLHLDSGLRNECLIDMPESDHIYIIAGMSESLLTLTIRGLV